MTKPLSGIKILDLSRLFPGPMCSLHLADLGAEVIKVEDTERGDYARAILPLNKTTSSLFLAINRNKCSIKLDFKTDEGKTKFIELSKSADVILESYRPGVMKKIGLDYETIYTVNPKIIYCSLTGYGQMGPYKDKAGHDLNFIAEAGILKKMPEFNKPQLINLQVGDLLGGASSAVMAILAAIIQRYQTNKGQYLDVSIFDGVVTNSIVSLSHLESKSKLGIDTTDMLNGALHCYNIYETKDNRFIALAALEFKFWERFCNAANKKEWVESHITVGNNALKMKQNLEVYFKSFTFSELMHLFSEVDCCFSPVSTIEEVLKNEHVKARKLVVNDLHPTEGNNLQFSYPVKSTAFEFEVYRSAPMHGEHNNEMKKPH